MNKLWIQLTLAFSLVTVAGVVLVALLANRQVNAEFRSFVAQSQLQGSPLVGELSDYYATYRSWNGVEQLLGNVAASQHGMMGHGGPLFILADANGHIVYSTTANLPDARLTEHDRSAATPIRLENATVGYLLVQAGMGGAMSPAGQQFLAQVNASLLQAGLLAGVLGLLLGVVIARGLASPLSRLSFAARQIAQGKLDQRLPVAGAEEIADVARAFNEMAAALHQSEQLRRNLIADVSHELRTPLTVVQGNLRALLDDVYPLNKAEIATIYDETVLLNRLVNDLRQLAQAEAGQLTLDTQPTELEALVRSAIQPFEAPAAAQGVSLTLDLPAGLPPVVADADRVRQVIHNLVANALRYTPSGGTVICSAQVETAKQASDTRNSWVELAVRDSGSGIDPTDLPHVFERFWRADRSRSREQGGSGLGLAIARQIIEAHGGQIGAESQPGRGSRFWFRLPVAGAVSPARGHE